MDRQLVVRPAHRTPLAAVVAAGVVVLASAAGRAESLPITTILPFDYGVTGIRADDGNEVVVTGGTGLPNLSQGLPAFVYRGPLDGMASATTTGDPRLHLFMPVFGGTTAYGAQFYGPNTHRFNPSSIAAGSIRAVGAYLENGPADFQKGMIYDGPLDGSGTWTSLRVPGPDIGVTIPHSTMGNLVVGNYDRITALSVGQPFVYDIIDRSYTLLDLGGAYAATVYGVWQNGGESSTSYTLIGGLSQTSTSKGQAFVASYDSVTRAVSGLTTYSYDDNVTIDTHFEGISAFNGGFSIAANYVAGSTSGAYAFIPYSGAVGSYTYGAATWKSVTNGINGTPTTGDTVIDDKVMGIYAVTGGIRSYVTGVPELDPGSFGAVALMVVGSLACLEGRLRRRV